LLKGFLGAIFDEVLQEISSETNTVLGALQNTRHVTLNFRSETLTAKGTVKREIKPTVTISGYEAPIKSGCSGGMYLSVEQAVDLAIATVVTRRTGAIPGWLVLDECFGDQDLRTKESCMEVLKQFAANRQVLVVDHATEFKESFNQFINIEYDHGTGKSTIASVG
jgi:DNA repair exonuclease SbcCD ATPase subunit